MSKAFCVNQEPEICKALISEQRVDSEDLAKLISVILRSKFGCSVCNLRITIGDEGLFLEGTVTSYHSKQLAQHVAKKATGEMVAANHISVRQANECSTRR